MATLIIAASAICQENGQVNHVKIRDEVGESSGQAPGKRECNLRHVVEVTRHTPPAGGQQEIFVLLAVGGRVGGLNQIGWLAPHGRGTVRSTYPLALGVGSIVDVDCSRPEHEDSCRERPR